jgi:hypothetical protein
MQHGCDLAAEQHGQLRKSSAWHAQHTPVHNSTQNTPPPTHPHKRTHPPKQTLDQCPSTYQCIWALQHLFTASTCTVDGHYTLHSAPPPIFMVPHLHMSCRHPHSRWHSSHPPDPPPKAQPAPRATSSSVPVYKHKTPTAPAPPHQPCIAVPV